MIIGMVGTPGSGKTYEAVKKILDNLKKGRFVCTNIDGMDTPESHQYIKDQLVLTDSEFDDRFRFLNTSDAQKFFGSEMVSSGAFGEIEKKICPMGALIVLDEVHKLFNSRDWQSANNRLFSDWASTHRHEGYDLVLVTQDIEKIDKQCRSLIEWTYFFRKINFLGSAVSKKYLCYSYTGDDHNGTPLAKSTRTYNPAVFPAYKSYSNSDAKEIGFMTHVNILKHPVFFLIPIVVCFCIWMGSKSSLASGDLFGSKKKLAAKTNSIPPLVIAPSTVPASVPIPVSAPVASPVSPVRVPPAPAMSPPDQLVKLLPRPSQPVLLAKSDIVYPPPVLVSSARMYYFYEDANGNRGITNNKKDIPKNTLIDEYELP